MANEIDGPVALKTDPALLQRLLEAARRPMAPRERFEQRVSFVYGQMGDIFTKDEVRRRLADHGGYPEEWRELPPAQGETARDDFKGDNAHLIDCIRALVEMNDAGALVPHGIGGHARGLLLAAAARLSPSSEPDEAGLEMAARAYDKAIGISWARVDAAPERHAPFVEYRRKAMCAALTALKEGKADDRD